MGSLRNLVYRPPRLVGVALFFLFNGVNNVGWLGGEFWLIMVCQQLFIYIVVDMCDFQVLRDIHWGRTFLSQYVLFLWLLSEVDSFTRALGLHWSTLWRGAEACCVWATSIDSSVPVSECKLENLKTWELRMDTVTLKRHRRGRWLEMASLHDDRIVWSRCLPRSLRSRKSRLRLL